MSTGRIGWGWAGAEFYISMTRGAGVRAVQFEPVNGGRGSPVHGKVVSPCPTTVVRPRVCTRPPDLVYSRVNQCWNGHVRTSAPTRRMVNSTLGPYLGVDQGCYKLVRPSFSVN